MVVDDVAEVDGLLVGAGAADALEGVLHRHGGLQVHELRGHDAAGGVVGVFQDLVDALTGLGIGVLQNALDHIGGHFFHDVHGVVQVQLVQHLFQFGVGKAPDQHFLLVGVQLHEYLRRQFLGQQAEHQGQPLLVQIGTDGRDVRGLQGQQHVPQLGIPFSLDQLLDLFQQLRPFIFQFKHSAGPPFLA